MQNSPSEGKASGKAFVLLLVVLLTVLCVLFHKSFDPKQILFANDHPFGALNAEQNQLPEIFTGNWQTTIWIGGESISSAPSVTAVLYSIFPPEILMKLYVPFTLLLFGLSVWLCFRELNFRPIVCILGGLAAGLNMHAFSIACWGLAHWVISFAMIFLAVAALVSKSIKYGWVRGVLAGTAVGIGLMEGFDVGAINSLYVGVFGLFAGLVGEKITGRTVLKSTVIVAIVAVFAAITAAHTISSLVGTQVKGTNVEEQADMTKEERWNWATQWSLPKKEILRIFIPGIFGYRMVDGENRLTEKSYWGTVAQTPGYEETRQGLARHTGSGEYLGIFVALIGILAIAQSFRKQNNPFSVVERKFIWFWAAMSLISLLLAFGRHAPFYQFVFAFPYFSTIRNPIKFLHPFHIAMLILFGYGLESLVRGYFEKSKKPALSQNAFEKKWTIATCIALGAAVFGWLLYVSSKKDLLRYLESHFPTDIAQKIARFSFGEVAWFVLFLAASVILVIMILRGKFVGKLRVAGILMGVLIVADLAHANLPWIIYQNYKEKYASNPVIDILRDKPYERRVIGMLPFQVNDTLSSFQQYVYYTEWLQHHFLYYNIQSIDIAQEPRVAADNAAYRQAFRSAGVQGLIRMWELTNVKYMFGLAGEFADSLNQQLDPEGKPFRLHTAFSIAQETAGGPFMVQTNSNGPFALIELTSALPRAKLYNNWQVVTNDKTTLATLTNRAFDPIKTVLIANQIQASPNAATNTDAGLVEIVNYRPKRVELDATVSTPSVLLLNDKHHPNWKVFVDGQQKPLLRANYIMRGVQLEPGEHKIEFRFEPPVTTLYVSLAGCGIGLIVLGFVIVRRKKAAAPNAKS